MELVTLK